MTTVAVLGTGTMGIGMARSLLRNDFAVRAWNRTTERAQPLAADGATVATSAAEAVRGADVVLLMLFDADAARQTLTDAAPDLSDDTVILQSSTVGPAGMARIGQQAHDAGWHLLDAPVLGTKQPAEDGKLVVLASGAPELRDRAQPVFDAIGSRTVWAGDELGRASALKLACNSWVAALTAAAAQSLVLAEGAGLDPHLVLDALGGGPSDSPYLHVKGESMITGKFPASFALDGVRKDLDLMAGLAGENGTGAPLVEALRSIYAQASALGHGDDDLAAVITAF
jgi:3-hydroxyisobutyrate dehydrogenase